MKVLKCIKLRHYNWQIVGMCYPGYGSPAVGQSGKLAVRQSVHPANWQSGRLIIGLMSLIFTLFCILPSIGVAQPDTTAADDPCTEHCGRTSPIIETTETVVEATEADRKNCPDSVQSVRKLMALSYGSCEVLDHPRWKTKENNGILVHGYNSQPGCDHRNNEGKSCTQIDDYQEIMSTHPYNNADKINECKQHMQCSINGNTDETCPALFAMAGESYAYMNQNNNEIDIFRHKTKDNKNNTFLGWNCSEYVTTAMALAGYRLVKKDHQGKCADVPSEKIGDNREWYYAGKYLGLARNPSCSCLTSVDITDPNNSIQPGDLIGLDIDHRDITGHIMMVEAVEEPFFKDEQENVDECDEEKIYTDHLKVRVNHSASTMGGPGSMKFSEYQVFNYQQGLSYGVGGYIQSCEEAASDNEEAKEQCWTEADQDEYTDYFYFFKSLGLKEGAEDPSRYQRNGEDGIWPGGSGYPLWPKTRKYLSAVCKARWHRKNNQTVPDDVRATLSAMNGNKPVLSVIRHKTNDPNCVDPEDERPKLKNENCLGDCVQGDKICAQY